jgi:hypothetical protein
MSSVQNDMEDAVETVRTNPLQPYRSPHIHHMLTTIAANIQALDISSSIGPEGTIIELPPNGPPLLEQCIAHIDDFPINQATKTVYFHVDTSATCVVTDQAAELHFPIPTQATCSTVAKGPRNGKSKTATENTT